MHGIKRRIARHLQLIAKYKASETIFIYQMGKVGSTTLEHALPNAIHIHAFYSRNHTCPVRLKGLLKFGIVHFFYQMEQEIVDYLLRRAFKQRKNTKIVTMVRDLSARNVSMFFHDLDAYLYAAHTNCLNTRSMPLPTRNQNKDLLVDVFNQEFNHEYGLTWFDREFLPMTGIDVYNSDFNKDQGFAHFKNGNTEAICIRTDKLKLCINDISDFVGQKITLTNANQANEKWYGELYQSFMKSYIMPEELALCFEKSKFCQHFFNSNDDKTSPIINKLN